MRIENIGDLFDQQASSEGPLTIDLIGLATQLYSSVNGDSSKLFTVNIKEKAITGN
jgi:hypothetical protein